MQTTLLGLAIAFIIALVAALIGPYFIDWNQFRPQFEAEAARVIGAPVRVAGKLDARLLPAPSLQLRSVVVGGANDLGKVRADKLDVEFSLGSLMRGEWRATELTINGLALDLGLDSQGRIDWPASTGKFNLGSLAIDRLNLTGRVALHDAASRGTLELNDIAFSGDVRSLAGSVRGDGNFMLSGTRYPFRVSSGQTADGSGTRVHLNIDPGARALSVDLDGVLSFEARAPRFDGTVVLAVPAGLKGREDAAGMPWRVSAKVKAEPSAARLEQIDGVLGAEDSALRFSGVGDVRFGASPLLRAALSARQLDADRFAAKGNSGAEPVRLLPGLRALMAAVPQTVPIPAQIEFTADQIMLGGRPLQNLTAGLQADAKSWAIDRLEFRAPGATRVSLGGSNAQAGSFTGALSVDSADPDALATWLQGRGEVAYRSQKPLRLRGDVTVAPDRVSIEAMKAEIDGGAVEGRAAVSTAGGSSRFEAELKAERLDLDAATALARSLAGPQGEWPDEARLTLDIGRATSAGQELRPFLAKVGYGAEIVRAGPAENRSGLGRDAGRRRKFRSRRHVGKTDAELERGVARPDHRADRAAGAGAGGAAQCDGTESRSDTPQAVARSGQERAAGRSRQRARRVRSGYAPAQGRRHDRGKAGHRGPARDRSRGARTKRVHARIQTVVRPGPSIAGRAGARSRDRGGRWPGAVRRLGVRRVACAVAAESEAVGNRPRCRSGRRG